MSKLLVALLALNIGVSLSKVFIFTWKSNYLIKEVIVFKKVKNVWKIHWMQRSTGNSDLSLWD